MSYQPTDVIEVLAWGRRVGAVALDPDTGWYAFAYTRDWVAGGIELAPLHMALSERTYEFPQLRRETFYGLPPLLADSLPDKFGNALVDALDGRARGGTDRHHAARPPGLCGRPGHGGTRVPAAGAGRGQRTPDRRPAGRPRSRRPSHGAR